MTTNGPHSLSSSPSLKVVATELKELTLASPTSEPKFTQLPNELIYKILEKLLPLTNKSAFAFFSLRRVNKWFKSIIDNIPFNKNKAGKYFPYTLSLAHFNNKFFTFYIENFRLKLFSLEHNLPENAVQLIAQGKKKKIEAASTLSAKQKEWLFALDLVLTYSSSTGKKTHPYFPSIAVAFHDLPSLQSFFSSYHPPTPHQGNLLIEAAKYGQSEYIGFLLSLENEGNTDKKNNNISNEQTETALSEAIQHNHAACVKVLLKIAGHTLSKSCKNGALYQAVENNYPACVKSLLQEANDNIDSMIKDAALIAASATGYTECLFHLLVLSNNTLSLSAKKSAFSKAAENGHLASLKYFLDIIKKDITILDQKIAQQEAEKQGHADCAAYLQACLKKASDDEKELIEAAARGELAQLKKLIEESTNDFSNECKTTALQQTVTYNHPNCVEYLLNTFNKKFSLEEKKAALLIAIEKKYLECLSLLIIHANFSDFDQEQAFIFVTKQGYLDGVRQLSLEVEFSATCKALALIKALAGNHLACAQYLFEIAKKEIALAWKEIALCSAAFHGHFTFLVILLNEEESAISLETKKNAMRCAEEKKHIDCAEHLREHISKLNDSNNTLLENCSEKIAGFNIISLRKLLIEAAKYGHSHYLIALLDSNVHLSSKDKGKSLLQAAKNNQLKSVELLLHRGNIAETDKEKALFEAASYGHIECMKCLLNSLTHPSLSTHDKAFFKATSHNHLTCARILWNFSRANIFSNTKGNALCDAAQQGHTKMVKFLLKKMGTDIDPQKLNSALIFAEQKNHIDCVQHLSEYIRASF